MLPRHRLSCTLLHLLRERPQIKRQKIPRSQKICEDRRCTFNGQIHSLPSQTQAKNIMSTANPLDQYSVAEMAISPSQIQRESETKTEKAFRWCEQNPGLARLLLNIVPTMIFIGLIVLTVFLTPKQPSSGSVPVGTGCIVSFEAYFIWFLICIVLNRPCRGGYAAALVCIFYTVLLFLGVLCILLKSTL